jgi:hypothetical protein
MIPRSVTQYLTMKTINSYYNITTTKEQAFVERFVREELSILLDRLNSDK